jgi:hypothetical protein
MSHEEAAAIVAAIERFERETAPAPVPAPSAAPAVSGWLRAARLEAVARAEPARFPVR